MTQARFKVLVSDPLGKAGMEVLTKDKAVTVDEKAGLKPEELKKIIGGYDAIIIRSGTKLTADILENPGKLRVIGRAGVGVDNVDMPSATKRGIIVMNTPDGNTISTAEHAFSMLMSLSRKIPQACQSVKEGQWKRSQFLGTELFGKVLGVIGFGRIGKTVAARGLAFGMRVLVFDPFITKDSVKEYSVEYADLDTMLSQADFVTVHTPLTPETKYIINRENIKKCKKGVKMINCARGGIIEEKALEEAIQAGIVAGAALDVFEKEPPVDNALTKLPQVICTPHLGASTEEAQENVAVDVAYQVLDALHERAIKNAVNLPSVDPEAYKVLKPWINLAEKLGLLYSQLFGGSIKSVNIRYGGEVTRYNLKPLTIAVIKGLLAPICGETVNFVNAPAMAKERGMVFSENRSTQEEDFSHYIEIEVESEAQAAKNSIMGTLFGDRIPRVVRINEFSLDVEPHSWVLFIHNEDKPGVVGTIGNILGQNQINIAEMSLGRVQKEKKMLAMTVINTDNEVSDKVLAEIKKFPPIIDAKIVKL